MELFDWRRRAELPFVNRYEGLEFEVIGREKFEELAERLLSGSVTFGDLIREFDQITPAQPRCPRIFISHRQVDYLFAERIAWLATQHGWDYWLDVHDPSLAAINAMKLPPPAQALAVALVIEVALLNCTHMLAAITDNSPGSAWIPYEYGRVKPRSIASQLASCWHNPRAAVIPAEYMNLGPIFRDEMAIRRWLAAEKTRFPLCTRTTSKYRGGDMDEPKKLPE